MSCSLRVAISRTPAIQALSKAACAETCDSLIAILVPHGSRLTASPADRTIETDLDNCVANERRSHHRALPAGTTVAMIPRHSCSMVVRSGRVESWVEA
jgi:hypothetical protein